jgi:hypothetical protein
MKDENDYIQKPLTETKLVLADYFYHTSIKAGPENTKILKVDHNNCNLAKAYREIAIGRECFIIYGEAVDGTYQPLKVDDEGNIKVNSVEFLNITQKVSTLNHWCSLHALDISNFKVVSVAIINKTRNGAKVQLEISPNNCDFYIDLENEFIPGCGIKVLVPTIFLQYLRLSVKSLEINKSTTLEIYFQGQV